MRASSATPTTRCRDRHCPKCQGLARADWLEARQAELLPVPYFHVVFTVPAPVADLAFHNKAAVYAILFHAATEALRDVAGDPRYLGAETGAIAVLHTWGQALHHHPHLHCIVPGGGISPDRSRWVACPPGFFLPVRVLSRRFRDVFVRQLRAAFAGGDLRFPGALAALADPAAFAAHLDAVARIDWVVFAKPPFAGPEQVLGYLGRYTHRVAIANSRLVGFADGQVSFTWKDYRHDGKTKTMTLCRPTSSSAASCSTPCPTGFTASAISASSPTATAAKSWRCVASCSPCRRRSRCRRGAGRIACAISPARTSMPVPAAAAGC